MSSNRVNVEDILKQLLEKCPDKRTSNDANEVCRVIREALDTLRTQVTTPEPSEVKRVLGESIHHFLAKCAYGGKTELLDLIRHTEKRIKMLPIDERLLADPELTRVLESFLVNTCMSVIKKNLSIKCLSGVSDVINEVARKNNNPALNQLYFYFPCICLKTLSKIPNVEGVNQIQKDIANMRCGSLQANSFSSIVDYISKSVKSHTLKEIQQIHKNEITNILELVHRYLGIPAEIVNYRPQDRVKIIKQVDRRDVSQRQVGDTIEVFDIFTSFMPFLPIKIGRDFYIYTPRDMRGDLFYEANIFVPREIRLRRLHGDERVWWGYGGSRLFEIGKGALVGEANADASNKEATEVRKHPGFYTCLLGYIPIAMSETCPRQCRRRNDCERGGFRYYKRLDDSFLRVFHITARTGSEVWLSPLKSQVLHLFVAGNNLQPGVKIVLGRANVKMTLESINFEPREKYSGLFISPPKLYPAMMVREKRLKIGVVLSNTGIFGIMIRKDLLKKLIASMLGGGNQQAQRFNHIVSGHAENAICDGELTRHYLCLKYRVHKDGEGFVPRDLAKKFEEVSEETQPCSEKEDEFFEFVMEVFLHSLAHVLLTVLSSKLQIEPTKTLSYYFDIDYDTDYVAVFVYELSNGGLGVLERSTIMQIGGMYKIWEEIVRYVEEIQKRCSDRVHNAITRNTRIIEQYMEEYKKYWEKYVAVRKGRGYFFLPPYALRFIVFREKHHTYDVDDFLQLVPVCADGCNLCLLYERGCHEPLEQVVKVSRNLTYCVITQLNGQVNKSAEVINRGLLDEETRERVFWDVLSHAECCLDIAMFMVERSVIDKIEKLLSQRPLKIRLLLDSRAVEGIKSELKRLKKRHSVEIRALDNLHMKIVVIDGNVVISGSMNLTNKGLGANFENVKLSYDDRVLIDKFEELWENAKPID